MTAAPERHPAIPPGAAYLEDQDRWEVGARNAAGQREGDFALYRTDGTLYMRCRYTADLQDGPFTIFHPNGQVARQGLTVAGEIHGDVVSTASDAETTEGLRACCVPPGAWQMRARYENGQLLGERFFDREGRALLSDGSLRPDRPAGIPDTCEFDEFSGRWALAPGNAGDGNGPWRYYTRDGRLDEETTYVDGRRERVRLFTRDGSVRQELSLDAEGRNHGPYRRRFVDGDESPYLDARIVEERGAHEHGQPVGRWQFFDEAGNEVRTVSRGVPWPAAADPTGPAFADDARDDWATLADSFAAEGRIREALCAAARAAARRREVDELLAFLARHTVALTPPAAASVAEQATAATENTTAALLSALVVGGEPATLLRALAAAVKGAPRAALDLVEAALLLAPEHRMMYLTRALVRLELGDPRGALADAARVAVESDETAQFIRDYARLLFPEWGFWPTRERLDADAANFGELPEAPGQPLEAIRAAIQVYATRLSRLREAAGRALASRATPAWLPPALDALLPDGPAPLRRWTATITDETDEGPETVEVEIDETIEPDGAGLPAIMRVARAQWAALTWLCWSVGLDRVALPTSVAAPPTFPVATGTAIARFFRVQDVLLTNGLRSLTQGVPGFTWEGLEVDAMPGHFAQMALDEYLELRALFLWLVSPENLSPFQSDLRQV